MNFKTTKPVRKPIRWCGGGGSKKMKITFFFIFPLYNKTRDEKKNLDPDNNSDNPSVFSVCIMSKRNKKKKKCLPVSRSLAILVG